MSPMRPRTLAGFGSFPRVGGDEPGVKDFDKMAEAFSPRERG